MHAEFRQALRELVIPGLRLLVERPWRLPFTHGTAIEAPSLDLEDAMVLVDHGEPELLLCNREEDPPIRLFFPRARELAPELRAVYGDFGPDEIIPFPGRLEEEAHVPLCACHVLQLALCTEALAEFFRAHADRVDKDKYEARESRIVRGHAMELEFPCFTMECHGPREPVRRDPNRVGRNDPCPCGSGKKFKRCHLLQRMN